MSLFKKNKGNLEENGFSAEPKNYFLEAVERRKVEFAGWLQANTGGYTPMQKKIALIAFCVLFGGLSFFILTGSLRGHGFNNRDLIINRLHTGPKQLPIQFIPDSIYQRAERTKQWLDSIRQNDTNRFKVILLYKPFLLENLQLIERIYQSQTK
jgi:hypothetical protein